MSPISWKVAPAFKPNASLLLLANFRVYEKSRYKLVSLTGPISSEIADTPKPIFLPTGKCTFMVAVFGAPSTPSHWSLYKIPILVASDDPAYAGLIIFMLYMYCVYWGSCCPKLCFESKQRSKIKMIFFIVYN